LFNPQQLDLVIACKLHLDKAALCNCQFSSAAQLSHSLIHCFVRSDPGHDRIHTYHCNPAQNAHDHDDDGQLNQAESLTSTHIAGRHVDAPTPARNGHECGHVINAHAFHCRVFREKFRGSLVLSFAKSTATFVSYRYRVIRPLIIFLLEMIGGKLPEVEVKLWKADEEVLWKRIVIPSSRLAQITYPSVA
jgi:hypothetical protein